MTNYSFLKGVKKMGVSLLIVGLPLLIQVLPQEWMNLTLSGAILLLVNWLKVSLLPSLGYLKRD